MADSKQAIGLLGGSFDPVHNGHVAIARSFIESHYISKLWILLTPYPPHKIDQPLSDYEDRFKMLQAAFQPFEHIEIQDIEKRLPRPSFTVQTLEYLIEQYPDKAFYLCMGEDSLRDFEEWKSWEKILELCDLLVAQRNTDKTTKLHSAIAENSHFVEHQPIDISSTKVRDRVTQGKNISSLVPDQVQQIIEKENLYRK